MHHGATPDRSLRLRRLGILALLVLTATAGLISLQPAGATATCTGTLGNGSENFEAYPLNFPQPSSTTTPSPLCLWQPQNGAGSASGYITNVQAHAGTQAWNLNDNNGGLRTFGAHPCAASVAGAAITVDEWVRFTSLPASGDKLLFTPGYGYYFAVDNTGLPFMFNSNADGSAGIAFPTATAMSVNTWYEVTFTNAETGFDNTNGCVGGSGGLTTSITVRGTGYGPYGNFATKQAASVPANNNIGAGAQTTATNTFHSFSGTVWIDDLTISGYPYLIPTAATSSAYTVINGFDVDNSGNNVVLRTNTGTQVRSLSGYGLIEAASFATPNCARADGVSSLTTTTGQYLSFVDCEATHGFAEHLRIRSPQMGTPAFPSGCGTECGDVNDGLDVDVPNALHQISDVGAFPFSFSKFSTTGNNHATVAWGYSEVKEPLIAGTGGRIGIYADTKTNLALDQDDNALTTLDTSTNPQIDQICAWTYTSGGTTRDYLAGVTNNGATGVFQIAVDVTEGTGTDPTWYPDAQIQNQFTNTGTYAGANAIGCAQDRILVQAAGSGVRNLYMVKVIGTGAPQELWGPVAVTTASARGVAFSGDGNWVSWLDGTTIKVAYASNATVVASITKPTGTFFGMALDLKANNLWVATTDHVYRYLTGVATCKTACSITTDDNGNPLPNISATSSSTSTLTTTCTVGCTGTETNEELTMRGFIFVLLSTVLGITGFGFYGSSARQLVFHPTLAGIGGGLLVAISTAFAYTWGWLGGWGVFLIVFLVGSMVALTTWVGRRATGA